MVPVDGDLKLWIGSERDLEICLGTAERSGAAIVHACKEPWHRLVVGYKGRAPDKSHPEYFFAVRGGGLRLMLNLIDAPLPHMIPAVVMDRAVEFIAEHLEAGRRVLVHCNQGRSRAPGIALLYLMSTGRFDGLPFAEVERGFREVYPFYRPAEGVRGFLEQRWAERASGAGC